METLREDLRWVYDSLCGVHMHFAGPVRVRLVQSDLWRSGVLRRSDEAIRSRLYELEKLGLVRVLRPSRRVVLYEPLPPPSV